MLYKCDKKTSNWNKIVIAFVNGTYLNTCVACYFVVNSVARSFFHSNNMISNENWEIYWYLEAFFFWNEENRHFFIYIVCVIHILMIFLILKIFLRFTRQRRLIQNFPYKNLWKYGKKLKKRANVWIHN